MRGIAGCPSRSAALAVAAPDQFSYTPPRMFDRATRSRPRSVARVPPLVRRIAQAAIFLACLAPAGGAAAAAEAAPYKKVVVLGFDGADAKLVERYLAEGRLPNLAKLKEQGIYSPLLSTNPPQT